MGAKKKLPYEPPDGEIGIFLLPYEPPDGEISNKKLPYEPPDGEISMFLLPYEPPDGEIDLFQDPITLLSHMARALFHACSSLVPSGPCLSLLDPPGPWQPKPFLHSCKCR